LFDRNQVITWAATRGLAAHAGVLAPGTPQVTKSWRLESLLRAGGIWRDVAAAAVPDVFGQIVSSLPGATPAIRQLLIERLKTPGGIAFAPVGGGFALPHPSMRVALGRDSGVVAILLLREALTLAEPIPDEMPVTRLIFFIPPSPRTHLELLGRLSRLLVRGPLRDLLTQPATDEMIFREVALTDTAAAAASVGEGKS
jgi:PTS system nitrogen regulatory IIA component